MHWRSDRYKPSFALCSPSKTRMASGFLPRILQFWRTGRGFLVHMVNKDSEVHRWDSVQ